MRAFGCLGCTQLDWQWANLKFLSLVTSSLSYKVELFGARLLEKRLLEKRVWGLTSYGVLGYPGSLRGLGFWTQHACVCVCACMPYVGIRQRFDFNKHKVDNMAYAIHPTVDAFTLTSAPG